MTNFHLKNFVGRGSETQLEVGENFNNLTLKGLIGDEIYGTRHALKCIPKNCSSDSFALDRLAFLSQYWANVSDVGQLFKQRCHNLQTLIQVATVAISRMFSPRKTRAQRLASIGPTSRVWRVDDSERTDQWEERWQFCFCWILMYHI